MYCPMSFMNSNLVFANDNGGRAHYPLECTPDCAWAVKYNGSYMCAIAFNCMSEEFINSRPLEDDAS